MASSLNQLLSPWETLGTGCVRTVQGTTLSWKRGDKQKTYLGKCKFSNLAETMESGELRTRKLG